jgi:hypothetical protein
MIWLRPRWGRGDAGVWFSGSRARPGANGCHPFGMMGATRFSIEVNFRRTGRLAPCRYDGRWFDAWRVWDRAATPMGSGGCWGLVLRVACATRS